MKITLIRTSRYPNIPLFATLILVLWLTLVGVATLINFKLSNYIDLCLFKRFTGYPCPTCGTTRGIISLLHGKFIEAWEYNPLVFSIGIIVIIDLLFKFIFARSIKISFKKRGRKIVWLVAIVLFLANWAYVILCIG
ncbi:DUF2752 domain-containing protein [bacterium]|nr:DUF2752 domain-containing protein [bacterium]